MLNQLKYSCHNLSFFFFNKLIFLCFFSGCDCWNSLCLSPLPIVVSLSKWLWPFFRDTSIGTNLHNWNSIHHVHLLPSCRQMEHCTPGYDSACRRCSWHLCGIMAQLPVRPCSRESTHTLRNLLTHTHDCWPQFPSTVGRCAPHAADRRTSPSNCPTHYKPHTQDGLARSPNKKDANIWTNRQFYSFPLCSDQCHIWHSPYFQTSLYRSTRILHWTYSCSNWMISTVIYHHYWPSHKSSLSLSLSPSTNRPEMSFKESMKEFYSGDSCRHRILAFF